MQHRRVPSQPVRCSTTTTYAITPRCLPPKTTSLPSAVSKNCDSASAGVRKEHKDREGLLQARMAFCAVTNECLFVEAAGLGNATGLDSCCAKTFELGVGDQDREEHYTHGRAYLYAVVWGGSTGSGMASAAPSLVQRRHKSRRTQNRQFDPHTLALNEG